MTEPLVVLAYGTALAALVGYVVSLRRRLRQALKHRGALERELADEPEAAGE